MRLWQRRRLFAPLVVPLVVPECWAESRCWPAAGCCRRLEPGAVMRKSARSLEGAARSALSAAQAKRAKVAEEAKWHVANEV